MILILFVVVVVIAGGAQGCENTVFGETVSTDDDISVATCPGDSVVSECTCVPDGGYCDGETVSADLKQCRGHAAHQGGAVKAKACCHSTGLTLVSNPPILAETGKSVSDMAPEETEPATVACPEGQQVLECFLHTFWSHEYADKHMKATIDGDTCVTPAACKRCGVQAICAEAGCTKPENHFGETVSTDDDVSVATCPGDSVVAECECVAVSDGAYCDGVTVSADMKKCRAHAAHNGGSVKADVCCANEKQTLVSNPEILEESDRSVSDAAAEETEPATVACPEGQHVLECFLHTFWSHEYADKHMEATIDGDTCVTPAACKRCGVQAICREAECIKPVDHFGETVSTDDDISVATCPGSSVVAECNCIPESDGGYCDGVTVSADMKNCRAHAAHNGGSVKADVCCKAETALNVVSNPAILAETGKSVNEMAVEETEPATVSCAEGEHVQSCLLHTFWSHEYADKHMEATVDGNSCVTPAACERCGVQAICAGGGCVAPEDQFGETISTDDDISVATCPGDSVVAECECVAVSDGAYCDGVTVSADMKNCRAHAAHSGGSVKASVCCTNEEQSLVSNPEILEETGRSVSDAAAEETEPATVACPEGQNVHVCLLHTFWSHEYADKHMKATADGNTCVTPAACQRCGVQAICG